MNLDFLDVLSQPTQKPLGTAGTLGTANVDPGLRVPNVVPTVGSIGNKMSAPTTDTESCSQVFPSCSQAPETEKPNIHADVPNAPSVPDANVTGDNRNSRLATVRIPDPTTN